MAASTSRMLSVTAAQHVAGLTKEQGKKCLARHLEWPVIDEDENMQKSIHLDYLYDILMFCVEKGFQWEQVCTTLQVSDQLLIESIGQSLTDTLSLFQQKSADLAFILDERSHKLFAEYIFLTFMRHFKLIQFVFTNDRDILKPNIELRVENPTEPPPLKESQHIKLWQYQQQYNAIEEKEAENAKSKEQQKEALMRDIETKRLQSIEKASSAPLTKESIENIIKDVLKTQTSSFVEKLKFKVDEVKDDLEFKLEKTLLPRPQALGQPPRFNQKPKTPLPTPQVQAIKKLDKPDRKGSGSSTRSSRSRASKS